MYKSFRDRVAKFWIAFAEEEAQIRSMLDNKADSESVVKYVSGVLSVAFEEPFFQVGQNTDGMYELIMTPEGNKMKYMQLYYWLHTAPPFLTDKWLFYASKPAHKNSASYLEMYGVRLEEKDVTMYYNIDLERRRINLEVFSPKLLTLDENQRYTMFFIILDQFISEVYTMEYIGYIEFIEQENPLGNAIAPDKFRNFIESVVNKEEWPKQNDPTKKFSAYQMTPNKEEGWTLREDIMSGISSCIPILNSYYKKDDQIVEDLKKDGVILGFLFYENQDIPKDNVVTLRSEIEAKILHDTEKQKIVNTLGGGTGFHFSYIDFIIYDYDAFIRVVKDVLHNYKFEEVGFSEFIYGSQPILLN